MGPICRRCCSRIRHDTRATPALEGHQPTMGQGFRSALPVGRQRTVLLQPILSSHKPHTRENGVRQLNQLLLRRFRIPGRRDIRAGVNPVEPVALRNLASWRDEGPFFKEGDPDKVQLQFVDLTCEDLPPGFVFDPFGLMVRCPPGPLAGLSLPHSGLGSALEGIVTHSHLRHHHHRHGLLDCRTFMRHNTMLQPYHQPCLSPFQDYHGPQFPSQTLARSSEPLMTSALHDPTVAQSTFPIPRHHSIPQEAATGHLPELGTERRTMEVHADSMPMQELPVFTFRRWGGSYHEIKQPTRRIRNERIPEVGPRIPEETIIR
jgi:hypothetical protein